MDAVKGRALLPRADHESYFLKDSGLRGQKLRETVSDQLTALHLGFSSASV
jgi:hypothetical protein